MLDPNSEASQGVAGQQQAMQSVAQALIQVLADASPEFTAARYSCRYVGGLSQATLVGVRADESEGWKGIRTRSAELEHATDRLRQTMYRPGLGTWFGAIITVDREGHASIDFNYDVEPDFGREVPAHLYVSEQRRFPRDAENIPEWLARKHDEGAKNPPPYRD
jgi:hypothetical protein